MPTDLQPSISYQVKEVTQSFDRLEREQAALVARLKYVVNQAIIAVSTEPNRRYYPAVRLHALGIVCSSGKRVPVPMVLKAWKIPNSDYYMTDCVGGLITIPKGKEGEGDLIQYETFVQTIDPATKEHYLDVIRLLATLTEEANRPTT